MRRLMTTTPLLMMPGPTPVAPEGLAALAEPVRSHTGPGVRVSMQVHGNWGDEASAWLRSLAAATNVHDQFTFRH
jgi:aspartate aminotransferase-like enzyme